MYCWASSVVPADGGRGGSRSPSATVKRPFDRQLAPSNVSSDVSRQYAGAAARTVNSSVSDCWTRRELISTRGLTVNRSPLGPSEPRQLTMAPLSAPGRRWPATTPPMTASTPSTAPARRSASEPRATSLVTHPEDVSRLAMRWVSRKAVAAPAKATVASRRCWVDPSSAQNTNRVVDGTMASKVDQRRKAAQSERNTAKNSASAAASRKPSSTGAGATTLWKVDHDAVSDARAASMVAPDGSP